MASSPEARRSQILELLGEVGFAEVTALQQRFNCSPATIRRDLDALQDAGYLRRTHGGAVAEAPHELPFRAKLGAMAEAKRRIAARAAQMLSGCRAVGFTGGTTTQLVARQLAAGSGLTVVTNALTVAMELASSGHTVVVTGGELRGHTFELVGPLAEPAAAQIHLDVIFVGVDGISSAGGLTTHNPQEARVNRVLIERSKKVVVVADHTKLGRSTFSQIVPIDVADVLVTDAEAPPEAVAALEAAGMRVARA